MNADFNINDNISKAHINGYIQNVQPTIMEENMCEEVDQKFIPDINKGDNIFGVAESGTAGDNDEQRVYFTEMRSVNITQLFEVDLKYQSSNESHANLFLVSLISADDLLISFCRNFK